MHTTAYVKYTKHTKIKYKLYLNITHDNNNNNKMSCPWINNRGKKDEEKTLKYGPLRWELKQQFPGYHVEQYNVIIDILGGWSRDLDTTMRKMLGSRGRDVLLRMHRAVISRT